MDGWEVSVSKKKLRNQNQSHSAHNAHHHGNEPNGSGPQVANGGATMSSQAAGKTTEKEKVTASSLIPCRFYRAGGCSAGKSCQFAHIKEDQSSLICKFYVKGTCKFGNKCAHLHVGPTELDAAQANTRKLMLGPRPENTTIANFSAPTDIAGAGGDHKFEALKSSSPSLLSISPLHSTQSVWSVSSSAISPSSPGRGLNVAQHEANKASGSALQASGTDGTQLPFNTVALGSQPSTFSSLSEQLKRESTLGSGSLVVPIATVPQGLVETAATGSPMKSDSALVNKSDDDLDFNLLPSSLNELLAPLETSDDEDMFGMDDPAGFVDLNPSSPPDSFVLGIRSNQVVRSEEVQGILTAPAAAGTPQKTSSGTASWTLLPNAHVPASHASQPVYVSDEDFPSLKAAAAPKSNAVTTGLSFAKVAKAGVVPDDEQEELEGGIDLSLEPLCPFAVVGKCRYGEYCRHLHGLQCPNCEKFVIHPYNADENEAHFRECEPRQRPNVDSREVECAICYEKVLSKKDGRFGLLNCDHPFCLNCIRSWRLNMSQDNAVTHGCPVCRTLTHFITPSVDWVTTGDRKTEMINEYKIKLGKIPCKHFNFGEGTCPFGTSCFYSHIRKDGTRDVVQLRKYLNGEEEMKIMNQVKLFDFIDAFDQQRTGAGRGAV